MNRFDNIDCMQGMAEYEDNHFDLAMVDPVYMNGFNTGMWVDVLGENKDYKNKTQTIEVKTTPDYFVELFRVSKNQIVFGGNYFQLPISRGWIVWDKDNSENNFSDCELAWTSFDVILRKYRYRWHGMLQEKMGRYKEERIHPTQKPTALYKWLLAKYAKDGDLILDTHVGSASSLIACEDMGFNYVAFEIDKDYYDAAQKRLKQFRSQLKLQL